jgi:hypothetical protein
MPRYLALQDIDLGIRFPYVQAGTILFDGPGGNIPNNWTPPSGAVDPLDAASTLVVWTAANNSAATGSFSPGGLSRQQWSGIPVNPPVTFFRPVPGTASPTRLYQMTGLGAALPPILGGS